LTWNIGGVPRTLGTAHLKIRLRVIITIILLGNINEVDRHILHGDVGFSSLEHTRSLGALTTQLLVEADVVVAKEVRVLENITLVTTMSASTNDAGLSRGQIGVGTDAVDLCSVEVVDLSIISGRIFRELHIVDFIG